MSVGIRRASRADAARIAELSAVLGYPVDPGIMAERLQCVLARDDNSVFVATHGDAVIGWIHGAEHDLLEVGRLCEILGLVVDRAARRGGAGRALIAAVEQWAVARHVPQVSVRSNVVRVESHPFYERLGYTRLKTQHSYRKKLDVREPGSVAV